VARGVVIDAWHCWLISIGDDCVIATEAMILAHDASTKPHIGYTRLRPTTIGDRVYIGARALILPGVTVGDDAIVGAGAVVSRDVDAGTVVVGNPAKVVGLTAEHAAKHRERMQSRPVWPFEGWTLSGGINAKRRAEMLEKLSDGEGYVA
jgi:maltose O-acetyltransferase